MRSSRCSLAVKLAVKLAATAVAAVLFAGCGGSDGASGSAEPDDPTSAAGSSSATASPSATTDPTDRPTKDPSDKPSKDHGAHGDKGDQGNQGDDGDEGDEGNEEDSSQPSVTREPFCDAIDPSSVADILGLDEGEVLADVKPGDEIKVDPSKPGVASQEWTCTIGQSDDSSIAATWTIRDAAAGSNDPKARMKALRGTLGAKNCEGVDDQALGEGTQGVDCSAAAASSTIGFTIAARAVVIDGTQLECYIASTDPENLPDLTAAAPEICGMFFDVVVG
jgi:hypothetical protein